MAWGGFDGLGGSRDQMGSGTLGKDFSGDGPSKETKTIANEKKAAMSKTEPSLWGSSVSPAFASAVFGNQLGPQIAGMKGFTEKNLGNLAQRMELGYLGMTANKVKQQFGTGFVGSFAQVLAVSSPIGLMFNELGKFTAKQIFNDLLSGAAPVYDAKGNITGAKTDQKGLISGFDPMRRAPDMDGSKEIQKTGTFTSSTTSTSSTAVDSGSNASLIPSSKARGTPDSSGSGRRSMFGQVVK